MKNTENNKTENLYKVFSKIDNPTDFRLFLEDLCTVREILDMADRLEGAHLLSIGLPYKDVSARTGLSSATISRISRCLQYGEGGYRRALEKLEEDGTSPECQGIVQAVCVSEKKGTVKHPVDQIILVPDWGIEGDAHAGRWHRQVSLLGIESVEKAEEKLRTAMGDSFSLKPGDFAENILTRGITLYELPIGTRLKISDALCEVTQIGKECHQGCEIRRLTGDCVMPREGIFVRVLSGGVVKSGDRIEVLSENHPDSLDRLNQDAQDSGKTETTAAL